MPDIFDVDFDLQVPDIIPPDKRAEPNQSIIKAILKPLQWLRDSLFDGFKKGIVPGAWAPGTYNLYDQVTYNKQVFEALKTTTATPDTTTDWMLIQENFIGIDERIKYNGQKLVLEYALNKQFDGVFRQPATLLNSDIYINNLPAVESGFRIGQTEAGSSAIGQSITDDGIGGSYPFVQVNNFQINIPTALLALTTEKAIRNFVGKYIPISLNYTIVNY